MPNEDYLLEESVLKLSGLRDITPEEIKARKESGPIPSQNKQSNYYQTSISPSFQHDTSFVGTEVASPRYPKTALMPLGLQGDPVSNAAVTSTAKIAGGGSSTPVSGKIQLQVPSIFTPVDQTVNLPGPLAIGLALEPAGTVFGVPTAAYQAVGIDNSTAATASGKTITVNCSPTLTGDYALFLAFGAGTGGSGGAGAPAGFTLLDASTGLSGATVSGTDSVSVTSTVSAITGSNQFVSGALMLLQSGGATPTVVQSGATSGGFGGGTAATVTLSSPVTGGNSLLVVCESTAATYGAFDFATFGAASDNKVNRYQLITTTGGGGGAAGVFTVNQLSVFLASGVAAGTTTVTIPIAGSPSQLIGGVNIKVFEVSGILSAASGIPRFSSPFTMMDPINLGTTGVGGGITGVLGVAHGGTATDLSSSGGTNQLVFQNTLGGPLTVGGYDYDKIPGVQKASKYNNNTLAGVGLISEVGTLDSPGHSANIAQTRLIIVPVSALYRVSFYMIVTTPATVSSTLPNLTFTWIDWDNNITETQTFSPPSPTGNTQTTLLSGTLVLSERQFNDLTYETTGYVTSGATDMVYALHLRAEIL